MPRKSNNRPMSFQIPLTVKPFIDAFPDDIIGRAMRLAMAYFSDKTLPSEDESLASVAIFQILKAEIDYSFQKHEKAIMYGKKSQLFQDGEILGAQAEPKRKNISKRVRFEVFKRDNFTCQYCGKSAPQVILEIDHITPVSKGGTNDVTNLVTSCKECNRGKATRTINNDSIAKGIKARSLNNLH